MSDIHQKWSFSTSRAMLGSIGPLARARVCDLVNPDPDKIPPAPQCVPWPVETAFPRSRSSKEGYQRLKGS